MNTPHWQLPVFQILPARFVEVPDISDRHGVNLELRKSGIIARGRALSS
jgi:hypothetical protein